MIIIDENEFCTTSFSTNNCDSGSPLTIQNKTQWFIQGLLSHTSVDTNSLIDVFVTVPYYIDWICTNVNSYLDECQICCDDEEAEVVINKYDEKIPETVYLSNLKNCGSFNFTSTKLPWSVPIMGVDKRSNALSYLCQGSLLNMRYVITTASCLKSKKGLWNM